jgi:hypothetical protein
VFLIFEEDGTILAKENPNGVSTDKKFKSSESSNAENNKKKEL